MDNKQLENQVEAGGLGAFVVKDDSMGNTFNIGDNLLMEKVPESKWGEIKNYSVYLIRTQQSSILRRILIHHEGKWTLLCDKEGIAEQPLPVEEVKELWSLKGKLNNL
ncbi:MAG: LexA family transcriptional regulator [Segetibacter sp.]|nr:LexA family transcriptional regulator [Segetibacter sp.]